MTKKEALKIILFTATFLALLVPLSYMLRTNGEVKDRFVGFYAEKNNSIDVVYIGSSEVFSAYVTPQIWNDSGITSYALSTNRQHPAAAKYLITEALKTQSPSLFVIDITQYAMNDEYLLSNMAFVRGVTDNLKYSINRINLINSLVPDSRERSALENSGIDTSDMNRLSYYIDIFKYHSNWKSLFYDSQRRTYAYEYPSELKGYNIAAGIESGEEEDFSYDTDIIRIDEKNERILRELLAFIKENDIKVLFTLLPQSMSRDEKERYNYVEHILNEEGCDFIDFNDYRKEIGIDFNIHFKDGGGHLNSIGASVFSKYFSEHILNKYDIEDKRNTEKYPDWDEAFNIWEKELKKLKVE